MFWLHCMLSDSKFRDVLITGNIFIMSLRDTAVWNITAEHACIARSVRVNFLPTVKLFLFHRNLKIFNLWLISRPCTLWNIACHMTDFFSWNISSFFFLDTVLQFLQRMCSGHINFYCIPQITVTYIQLWRLQSVTYKMCDEYYFFCAVIEKLSVWVVTMSCVS